MADMAEAAPQPVAPASKPLAVAPAEPKPEVSAPPAEAGWSMSSWKWDPYNLRATAVLPGEGEDGAGRPVGNGEAVPPATAAAPAPLQPPLVPSYAMSTGSRAKGPPTCQVEFCGYDLTGLKEYHQRYKICENHLKVHSVVREGKCQRFCQQCGRFHVLGEFDGDKRSCRARLQRHNARRRKKTETDAASKAFGSAKKVPKSDPGSGDQAQEHAAAPSHMDGQQPQQQQQMQYAAPPHREDPLPEASGESVPRNEPYATRPGSLGGALQWAQPYQARGQGLPEPSGSSGVYLRGQGGPDMFTTKYMGPLDLSTAAALQHYENAAFLGPPVRRPAPAHLRELYYEGGQKMEPMAQGHMGMHPSMEMQYRGMHPGMDMHMLAHHPAMGSRMDAMREMPLHPDSGPPFTAGQPSQEVGRALTFPDREPYISEETLARVSAKLFQCSPAKLPADIKHNMVRLLGCGSNRAEGYIRPGCVHFTITATTSHAQARSIKGQGVRHIMESLLESGPDLWGAGDILVQLNDEIGFLCDGKIQHVLSCGASQAFFPTVTSISSQVEHGSGPISVQISGRHLAGPDTTVLGRCQGRYVKLDWAAFSGQSALPSSSAKIVVTLPAGLPGGMGAGVVYLEVVRGSMVSQPRALLVLSDVQAAAEVAAEVRQLEQDARPGELEAFLLDLDCVLELRNTTAAHLAGDLGPKRPYDTEDVARVAGKARRILAFAAARGWPALARLVLPVALADGLSIQEAFAAGGARSVLHLAVRSRNSAMVALLLEWAGSQGYEPDVKAGKVDQLSVISLAALQPQSACYLLLHEIYTDLRPSPKPSPFETSQGCGCLDSWALGSHDTSSEPQDAGCVPPSAPERTHSAYIPDPADEGDPASEEEGSDCQAAPSLIDGSPALPPASPGLELVTPQGSSVKDEAFVPGTPEPSTELRRQPSPPPAADVPSILQTSSKPGSGPKPPEQAAAKPWHAWSSVAWLGAACSKLPQLPGNASLHCNSSAVLVAGIGIATLLLRNYMESAFGHSRQFLGWRFAYQGEVGGTHVSSPY